MWVIKFDDVWKQHRGVATGPASLRSDLTRLTKKMRGLPAPKLRGNQVPALAGLSFEIEQGSAVALVGANGAGKSTALRLMSRIAYPTGGRVHVRGRIGALLEVGSGVHPELSGRENIWLYGSIIGIPRSQIRARFDEIVEFSELSEAIDKQAKFYSSGMQLRLGFAIATFLEPQSLLVDESLATADLNFQLKCIDRLATLVRQGTSLVFVSHELAAVESLCTRALLLERGQLVYDGDTRSTLSEYRRRLETARERLDQDVTDDRAIRVVRAAALGDDGLPATRVPTGGNVTVRVTVESTIDDARPVLELAVNDGRSGDLIACSSFDDGVSAGSGRGTRTFSCHLRGLPLRPRSYRVWAGVRDARQPTTETNWGEVAAFRVDNGDVGNRATAGGDRPSGLSAGGPVDVAYEWTVDDA